MVPSPLAKLVNVIAIGCEEFGSGPYVAFGSITVFEVLKYDFRITLENGLNSDIAACPKRPKELNRRDHESPKLRG
jgi:hypothetical protein